MDWEQYLSLGPIFSFIFGLLIGSFVNCLAWRRHQGETILGRSYCPQCRHQIAWYDNIPLLSFLLLSGRCRHCRQKISWQYPLAELATGLLFYGAFVYFGANPWLLLRAFVILALLLLVFIYDYRWYLIPVPALAWGGLAIFILGLLFYPLPLGYYLFATIVVVSLTLVFFGAQYLLTKGRGLGEGDIWLGAFLGICLPNIREISVAILSAYLIGALFGLITMALGHKKWQSKLPLGVFLSLGAVIGLFWGQPLAAWYLSLF
jgi:prepilin signal peptidase PulO-like enzyme (type II secretory pathway)